MSCDSVCVLFDDDSVPAYQAMAVQTLVDRTSVDVSLVVVNDGAPRCPDRPPRYLLQRARTWGAWLPVWAGVLAARRIRGPPAYDAPTHISTVDALADAEVRRCVPTWEDRLWRSIPDATVDEIAASSDVVVRFGFGLLTGRILDAPEHGVLSFHCGDIRESRGRIGALWEFVDGADAVGVTLQQLTDRIDGGRIVAVDDVPIEDTDTFGAIKRRQRTSAMGDVLVAGVENLDDEEFDPIEPETLGPYRSTPTVPEVCRYLRKNWTNKLRRGLSRRFDGGHDVGSSAQYGQD